MWRPGCCTRSPAPSCGAWPCKTRSNRRCARRSRRRRRRSHSSSTLPALEASAEFAGGFPVGVPLGDRLPLVIRASAPREGELDLRPALFEIDRQWYEGQPVLAYLVEDPVDLDPVQQQLAGAPRLVIRPAAEAPLGDVQAVEHDFAVVFLRECVG